MKVKLLRDVKDWENGVGPIEVHSLRIQLDERDYLEISQNNEREIRVRGCDGVTIIRPEASNAFTVRLIGFLDHIKLQGRKPK